MAWVALLMLALSSRAEQSWADRGVSADNPRSRLSVETLRHILRDENYILIIDRDSDQQDALRLWDVVEVRIFRPTATAAPKPAPLPPPADGPDTVLERLEQMAREAERPADRIQALTSLTELNDADEAAALMSLKLLRNDQSEAVREAAMDVLVDVRGLDAYDVIEQVSQEDSSPDLRIRSLNILVGMSRGALLHDLEIALLRAAEDPDRNVAAHAKRLHAAMQRADK